jgi:LuxR family maltose regulon positive regulatory protein
VRADQLRFRPEEVGELLGIGSDQADELLTRTDGWAAGVQLIAMSLRSGRDSTRMPGAFGRDDRHLVDYISSELLQSLSDQQRDFMVRASPLEQVTASLTDHALGMNGSARLLEELEQIDPFITRVDESGDWYRWHPVVRDALRRELDRTDPEQRTRVLKRAARWYLERGEVESAIRQLTTAEDIDQATGLLLRYEDSFLDAGSIGTFLALADSLGLEAVSKTPELGLDMAWAALVSGHLQRVAELLHVTEAADSGHEPAPAGWSTFAGSLATVRALAGYEPDPRRAESHARQAVALETDPALPGYAVSRFALGLVLEAQRQLEQAVIHLEQAWERSDVPGMPIFARLPLAGTLAVALLDQGQTDQARALLLSMAPTTRRLEETLGVAAGPAIGRLCLGEAILEFEEGDLSRARRMLARAVELLRVAHHPTQTVRGLLLSADAEMEAGNTGAAQEAVAEAREISRNDPIVPGVSEMLEKMENRVGRSAVRTARTQRRVFEELTDRELSILRALAGHLSQREIGRELYLSINTVKGYTKSLYRKLGVASRSEAVERARALSII